MLGWQVLPCAPSVTILSSPATAPVTPLPYPLLPLPQMLLELLTGHLGYDEREEGPDKSLVSGHCLR